MAQKNTNPLNYPRYVRGLRPALPESLPTYVEDEFEKLQNSMDGLAWEADYRIVSITANFETDLATLEARVATEEQVRADADTAAASRITTVEVAVDDHEGRITTTESATATHDGKIATLELKRTITLDVDGYAIGWEAVNAGVGTGTIVFRTDTFAVGAPGSSTVFPFKIVGGVVYINEARIETASIGTLHLAGQAVTNAKIADGAVDNLKISGTLQSDNYNPGVSGWKIDKTGATLAEFNGVVLSRDLILGSGTVNIGPYGPASGTVETFILDTGISVGSWDPNSGPLAVSLGFQNTEVGTLAGDEAVTYWEARPKAVFARNRYIGAATICIEVEIVGKWQSLAYPGSGGATAAQLTWKVYDVT